jgi:solute carrier family 10 (sodium/bile acid cotransporter), member 7
MIIGFTALGFLPTTISSNVVLTRLAGGDDAAATIEVVLGNLIGPFISPSLITLLLPNNGQFESWQPGHGTGLSGLYKSVLQQIGSSVLLPLIAGHLIQCWFPLRVKNIVSKFYLAKISTLCLILLVW